MFKAFEKIKKALAGTVDLESLIDQEIAITVTLYNAKAGAIAVTADEQPIYISGLCAWSEDMMGKKVRLSGILRRGRVYPDVDIEDGVPSQGMTDEPFFIENYRVR